jgi:hypothetical protein
VEEAYLITYKPFVGFMVPLPDRDILFKKKGKMQLANFAEIGSTVLTIQVYTKVELKCVHQVHDLICVS